MSFVDITSISQNLTSCLSKSLFLTKLHLTRFGICRLPCKSAAEHESKLDLLP